MDPVETLEGDIHPEAHSPRLLVNYPHVLGEQAGRHKRLEPLPARGVSLPMCICKICNTQVTEPCIYIGFSFKTT